MRRAAATGMIALAVGVGLASCASSSSSGPLDDGGAGDSATGDGGAATHCDGG